MNLEIVYGLLLARITVRYRGSLSGLLWVLFQPVTLFLVQLWVFAQVLAIDDTRYGFYLASGFLPWFFFQQSIAMGTGTFLAYARLIQTVTVAPLHYLSAVIIDTFLSFILSLFVIFAGLYLWFGGFELVVAAKILLAIFPLLLGTFFVVWICATSQVFYRDTAFIMPFLLNILFVITPIFYSDAALPQKFKNILQWNPIFIWLVPFRLAIAQSTPNFFLVALLKSFAVSTVIGIPSLFLWKKCKHALISKL